MPAHPSGMELPGPCHSAKPPSRLYPQGARGPHTFTLQVEFVVGVRLERSEGDFLTLAFLPAERGRCVSSAHLPLSAF